MSSGWKASWRGPPRRKTTAHGRFRETAGFFPERGGHSMENIPGHKAAGSRSTSTAQMFMTWCEVLTLGNCNQGSVGAGQPVSSSNSRAAASMGVSAWWTPPLNTVQAPWSRLAQNGPRNGRAAPPWAGGSTSVDHQPGAYPWRHRGGSSLRMTGRAAAVMAISPRWRRRSSPEWHSSKWAGPRPPWRRSGRGGSTPCPSRGCWPVQCRGIGSGDMQHATPFAKVARAASNIARSGL